MQTYSMGTVATAVLLLFFVSYAWQPVEDNSIRMVEIPNAKPDSLTSNQIEPATTISEAPTLSVTEELSDSQPNIIALEGDSGVDVTADLIASQSEIEDSVLTAESFSALDALSAEGASEEVEVLTLPTEYDQFDATAELTDDTTIGSVTFANAINEISYAPETPGKLYETGFYTVYATFDYENMANGMVWSWVWRQNGRVISGGNEVWQYGADGPGYIYLAPIEGFSAGEYTVEIWVNGNLQASDNMIVRDSLATSSQ